MKKTLITLITMVSAVGVFAQGTLTGLISFNNFISGTLRAPVFNIDPAHPTDMKQGQSGSPSIPTGTQTYAGAGLLGSGFTAQLFIGASTATDDQLTPFSPTTTFRTATTGPGLVNGVQITTAPIGSDRIQLRVWDNQGGTITNWTQLYASGGLSGPNGQFAAVGRGWSTSFLITPGDPNGTPAGTPAFLVGLTSFQLFQTIPEPSVIALGVLGVGALILFRRRKN